MWTCQTLEGLMCLCMGLVTVNLPSPDDFKGIKVPGTFVHTNEFRESTTYTFNQTLGMIPKCGSKELDLSKPGYDFAYINYGTPQVEMAKVPSPDRFLVIKDPWNECIHNAAPLALTVLCMILFSVFVQMAEGLHFGIVPYVSRPALGVVSGMVGAGGNFGGVMGSKYIVNAFIPLDNGFINLGIVIIVGSLTMFGLYFPEHGGMLFKKGGLGSYDPQLIKVPAGMVGADQLNYANVKTGTETKTVSA